METTEGTKKHRDSTGWNEEEAHPEDKGCFVNNIVKIRELLRNPQRSSPDLD
jgi:hypothetical protein